MDRSILIIFAIGAAFIYFAMSMFAVSSGKEDAKWSVDDRNAPYAQYYKKDVLGDPVLDLSEVSLAQAKTIWSTTPTKDRIVGKLPDFSLAKSEADLTIVNGEFKQYLLKYLSHLEEKYIGGEITADQARNKLSTLK